MINPKSVQEVIDAARIEEVVGDFVQLKRRGSSMIGLCPFHGERTPSFNVSPVRGIYKCFGCGKGGNAINFVMEHESLTFPEAIRYVAKKYNIELEETVVSQEFIAEKQAADSLIVLNEYAQRHFETQLFETDLGKSVGLSYFKQRGFREETIRKFGLGYAPDRTDELTKLAQKDQFKLEQLQKLGLTSAQGRDFFRNRVMFTIHSVVGKPIAFAGRIMQKDAHAPKYINSPETEVYTKSKVLYGIFFAKREIQKRDECILVEGYTDVISLHQAGIEHVVASSGTSLTVEQIRLIKRYTTNIKIIYDGDAAGIKAALRGLDMVLEEDMNVKIVLLPNGEDPDSFVQRVGATAFEEFIKTSAKDFILFKTNLLLEEAAGDPIQKSKLIKDIVSSIARIPDAIRRSVYLRECAALMNVDEGALMAETQKSILKAAQQQFKSRGNAAYQSEYSSEAMPNDATGEPPMDFAPDAATKTEQKSVGDAFQERDIVRILIAAGAQKYDETDSVGAYLLRNIADVLNTFENKLFQQIVTEANVLFSTGQAIESAYFIHHKEVAVQELAAELLVERHVYSENWVEKHNRHLETQQMPDLNFDRDSLSALQHFKHRKIQRLRAENALRIKQANDEKNYDAAFQHMKVDKYLTEVITKLSAEMGINILPPL
jgi:DNA primase